MVRGARGVPPRSRPGATHVRVELPRRRRACSVWRGTPRRPRGFESALAARSGLPARPREAGRGAARRGTTRASCRQRPPVRSVDRPSGSRSPPRSSASAASRRRGAIRRRRSHHLQRAVALFPEWGAAHYALALSYRALGRRDEAQRALERHRAVRAAMAGASTIRSLARSPRCSDDAQTRAAAGAEAGRGGRSRLAPSRRTRRRWRPIRQSLQAHANLISLYGNQRNWAKAEEHYRAVVALGVQPWRRALRLRRAPRHAGEVGSSPPRPTGRRSPINPRHARACNNLGQTLEQLA